jgi:hypothetical protein
MQKRRPSCRNAPSNSRPRRRTSPTDTMPASCEWPFADATFAIDVVGLVFAATAAPQAAKGLSCGGRWSTASRAAGWGRRCAGRPVSGWVAIHFHAFRSPPSVSHPQGAAHSRGACWDGQQPAAFGLATTTIPPTSKRPKHLHKKQKPIKFGPPGCSTRLSPRRPSGQAPKHRYQVGLAPGPFLRAYRMRCAGSHCAATSDASWRAPAFSGIWGARRGAQDSPPARLRAMPSRYCRGWGPTGVGLGPHAGAPRVCRARRPHGQPHTRPCDADENMRPAARGPTRMASMMRCTELTGLRSVRRTKLLGVGAGGAAGCAGGTGVRVDGTALVHQAGYKEGGLGGPPAGLGRWSTTKLLNSPANRGHENHHDGACAHARTLVHAHTHSAYAGAPGRGLKGARAAASGGQGRRQHPRLRQH